MLNSNQNVQKENSQQSTQNRPQTYRVIKLIGEGAFGKAYLVECNADKVSFIFILIFLKIFIKFFFFKI
jgi:serine/threonine protein kinase